MKIHYTLDQYLIVLSPLYALVHSLGTHRGIIPCPIGLYLIRYQARSRRLNVTLFDRKKRKAHLTPEGQRIYQSVDLLDRSQKMQTLLPILQTTGEPELQIIVDGIIPMKSITTALSTFASLEIPTRVRLDIEYQEGVPDRFFADNADMMILLDFTDTSGELSVQPLERVGDRARRIPKSSAGYATRSDRCRT